MWRDNLHTKVKEGLYVFTFIHLRNTTLLKDRSFYTPSRARRDLHSRPPIMRFQLLAAISVLFAAASALDEPLDIKIEKSVECTRKSQKG